MDIKTLAAKVADEITDAVEYAKMAADVKASDPELSRTLSEISAQEFEHMNELHKALAAEVKAVQAMYKEV